MKPSMTIIPLAFACALTIGCGSSGSGTPALTGQEGDEQSNEQQSNVNTGGDSVAGFAAIAGLWDVTEDGDIQYQEFTTDGQAINWDYDADEWGDGENCYDRFAVNFTYLGGNQYEGFGEVVTVVVNGDQITITDSFGTGTYPRLQGLSTADFNRC